MKPTKEEKTPQKPPDQRTMVKGTKALRQHDRQAGKTWRVVGMDPLTTHETNYGQFQYSPELARLSLLKRAFTDQSNFEKEFSSDGQGHH